MRWEEGQNMRKICATLQMGSIRVPHNSSFLHFWNKKWWYFWSGRSADHLKYPQGTFLFFRKILVFWGSKIFWRSKNIHPKPIILMGLPQKLQNMRNICANMCSTYFPLPIVLLYHDSIWALQKMLLFFD